MMISTLFALLGAVSALPHSNVTWEVGQMVKTTSGNLKGHASTWQPAVSEYLGIPYATPPVGQLRFAPPKAYNSTRNFNAARFSPDCPANLRKIPFDQIRYDTIQHTIGDILAQAGDNYNEDCLTLNVWSKPQSGEKAKAVMIWVYGGGFNTGNSQSPAYNGARLANDKDVVVVSMNYRVNIFGFPGADFMDYKNPGLQDQRLAVEWVRDNIASFGGDPKRIILFGQSAGGASVDLYSYAWTKDPIVYGFIPESGSAALGSTSNLSTSAAADPWYKASAKLACGDHTAGAKTLDCMRAKPWQVLLEAIRSSSASDTMQFRPRADGKIVFPDIAARLNAGTFIKAPILIGNTDDEGGLTSALAASKGTPATTMMSKRQAASPLAAIGCGSHIASAGRAKQGVPAWRYVYKGVYPNQDIGSKGAWHGADIGLQFGTSEFLSRRPDTPEEKKMENTIMTAWTEFAKDPQNGLKKLGWPVYDPEKPTVITLGGRNDSRVKFANRAEVEAKDSKGNAVCK